MERKQSMGEIFTSVVAWKIDVDKFGMYLMKLNLNLNSRSWASSRVICLAVKNKDLTGPLEQMLYLREISDMGFIPDGLLGPESHM
ncbi:hypothetical protein YC2023_027251 [Brassica napus]